MSRVMLAVKVVLAAHDKIPVLVFDEIDANVGGEMGKAVGEKLHVVAANRQVICITHLPQVAAQGASHYVVSKSIRDGRTSAEITPIAGKERTEELARMLGGRDLTSVTLKHAEEMLAQAGKRR
jgi:DNA repair protein RecN (Recombination protein N)